jgi:hypothetical protein
MSRWQQESKAWEYVTNCDKGCKIQKGKFYFVAGWALKSQDLANRNQDVKHHVFCRSAQNKPAR